MPEVIITPEEQQRIKKGYEKLNGKIDNSPEGQEKLLNFVDQYISYKKQTFDQEADKNLVKGIKDFKHLYSPEFNNAVRYKANIPISSFKEPIQKEPTIDQQTAAFNKKAMAVPEDESAFGYLKDVFNTMYGPEMMATLEKEKPGVLDYAAKGTGYTAKYLADFMTKTVGGLMKGTGAVLNMANANPVTKEANQAVIGQIFTKPGQKVSELAVKEEEQKPIGDLFKQGDVEPLLQGISSLGAFMASSTLMGGSAAEKLSKAALTGGIGTKLSKLPGYAGKYAPGFASRFLGQVPGMAPIIAGDAQAEGLKLGLKGQALDNYTAAKTAVTLTAFSVLPTNLLTKKFSNDLLAKYILNPKSESVLTQLMKTGLEGAGSAGSGVLANIGERAVSNVFADETGQEKKEFFSTEAFQEYGKSAATMFILHAVPALKQTAGTIVNGANPAYTDAISRMAANSKETFAKLDKEVEMGLATKEDADKAKGLILKIKPYVYNAYGNKNVPEGAKGVLAFKEAELEDLIAKRNKIAQRVSKDLKPGDNVRIYDQFGKVLSNSAEITEINVDPNNPENVVVKTTFGTESVPAKQVVKNEASQAAKEMVEINKKIQNTKNTTTQLKNGKFIKGRLISPEQLTSMANSSSTNGRLTPYQVRMMSAESGFYNDSVNPLNYAKDARVQGFVQQIKDGKLVLTPAESDMPVVVGENGQVIDGAKRVAQAIVDSEGVLGQYDNTIEVLRPITESELVRNISDVSELDPEFIKKKWEDHEVSKNPTMEKELEFGEGKEALSFQDAVMQVYQKTLDAATEKDTEISDQDIIDGSFVGEEEGGGINTTDAKDIHEEFADKYNEASTAEEKKKILEEYKERLNKRDKDGNRIFNVDPRVSAMRAVIRFAEQYGIPKNELVDAIATGLMPSAPDGVREAVAGYIKWMDKRGMLGKVEGKDLFRSVEAKRIAKEKEEQRAIIAKARKEGQIINKRERFAKEVADKIRSLIKKRDELPLRSQERAQVDMEIEALRNDPFPNNKEKTGYYNANRDILDPMVDEALKVEEKPKEAPKEEPVATTEEPVAEPTQVEEAPKEEPKPKEKLKYKKTYKKGGGGYTTEIDGNEVSIDKNYSENTWVVSSFDNTDIDKTFSSLNDAKAYLEELNNKPKVEAPKEEVKPIEQAKPIAEDLGATVGREVTLDDGTKGVVTNWEGGAGVTIKFEDGSAKLINGSKIVEVGEPKEIEVVIRPTEEEHDTATEDLDVDNFVPIGEEPIERENTFANRAEEFDPINNKEAVAKLFDKLESLDILKRNEKNTNCP